MASGGTIDGFRETLLFLGTAGLVAPLFHRLKLSPIIGFLLAGIVLGPQGLGRFAGDIPLLRHLVITNIDEITHVAEFGVVFLMFMIGLELSWPRLHAMRKLVFGLGALQVVGSASAIALVAFTLGQTVLASAMIGVALALSSTAIVVPVLAKSGRLNTQAGRAVFSVLLFQDLAVAPILIIAGLAGASGYVGSGSGALLALAPAVIGVVVATIAGRLLLRPLFRHVAAARSNELFVAACLLVVVGAAGAANAAGLSMALGAFVAGLLLSETEYRREIEVTIEPFQGLLLGLFFVTVGIGLDLNLLLQSPATVLGLASGLIILKMLIVRLLSSLTSLKPEVCDEVALLTGPAGEFAFVILGAATASALVPSGVAALLVVVASITMLAVPILAKFAETRAELRAAAQAESFPEGSTTAIDPVLIVGYGRVGRLIGEMLRRHGIPYLAIDGDPSNVARERRAGKPIVYGDATRPEFLRRSGIMTARALVATMDEPEAIERIVAIARSERPTMTIVARARDAGHAAKLYGLGVTDAVPETVEASLQLSEALLVDIGVPMGLVIASIHEKRDEFRKQLARPESHPRRRGETAARKRDKEQDDDAPQT